MEDYISSTIVAFFEHCTLSCSLFLFASSGSSLPRPNLCAFTFIHRILDGGTASHLPLLLFPLDLGWRITSHLPSPSLNIACYHVSCFYVLLLDLRANQTQHFILPSCRNYIIFLGVLLQTKCFSNLCIKTIHFKRETAFSKIIPNCLGKRTRCNPFCLSYRRCCSLI